MKSGSFVVLAVVILIASAPLLAGLSDGLVARYGFNGNAKDESGNGHDGAVHGATLTVDRLGNPDRAYSFDGINDYISVPYAGTFQSSQFTLATWVQTRGDVSLTSTSEVIVARGEDSSTDRLWSSLEIAGRSDPWGTGTLLIYEDNGDTRRIYDTGIFPRAETWTHVAVTRSLAGEVTIYVNGYVVGHWDNTPTPATICTQELTIGARWWSPSTSGPYQLAGYFSGAIDDVMLYNRALLRAEIAELAADSTPPINPVPLPGSVLLGVWAVGLVGWRLRRRTE